MTTDQESLRRLERRLNALLTHPIFVKMLQGGPLAIPKGGMLLGGRHIIGGTPVAGQVLRWNALLNRFEPQDIPSGNGGVTTFLGLTDTPGSYSGQALLAVRVNAAENALEFFAVVGGHDPVTLAVDAQVLLNLSTQELGLVAKAANLIFAGPASGGAVDPTFRALVLADIATAALGTGAPDGTKYLRDDRTWQTPAGGGNTLDAAYDQGGAGAGRIVTVDSGAVELRHTSNVAMLATRDPGDAADRFALSRDGDMSWGSGAAAADIVLSRAAANRLAFAAGDILSVQYVADIAGTTRITTSAASPHVHIDETMRVDQALGIMSNPSAAWAEFLTVSPTLPAILTPPVVSVLKVNPSLTTTQGFGIYYALEGILSVVSQGSGQTIYEYGLSYVVVATNNTLNVNTWAEFMGLNMQLSMNAGASATLNVTLAASGRLNVPTFLGTPASINVATMHGLMVYNHGHARVANSYGIRIYDQTGSSVAAYGIYVEDADTYALWVDAGLSRFDGDGTHVFELPVNAVDPTGGGGAATGRIPCTIGGVTRHLAYY